MNKDINKGAGLSFYISLFLGAFSHVISRGNARKNIYLEYSDFELSLDVLTKI